MLTTNSTIGFFPQLSVVIPTFNHSRQLWRCLSSVLNQSLNNLEVVLVDDGSTDGTLELALQIAAKDPRVVIYSQLNQGAGAARNTGLNMARGEFVHFVDSDDWLDSDIYSALFKYVKLRPELDLLLFQYNEVDYLTGKENKIDLFGLGESEFRACKLADDGYLLLRTSVVPWNKLIRRSYLKKIRARFEEVRYANDRSFHFRVVTQTPNIFLCGMVGIKHEVNRLTSLTGRHGLARLRSSLQTFETISNIVSDLELSARKTVFDVNMQNLAWEYQRAHQNQKAVMACEIWSWFDSGKLPFQKTDIQGASWVPLFSVIKGVALTSNFAKKIIPVVMATDDKYVPYLMVSLHSISQHLSNNATCVVYILHNGLPNELVEQLEGDLGYTNIRIFCVSFAKDESLSGLFNRAHYSAEMYLRLWIPELFDVYPKVLYLDCDLIVQRDLCELFDTDISSYDLAGVRDFNNKDHRLYVDLDLGLQSETYVNSGVLLFNTARLLASDFRRRCMELLDRYKLLNCPDQDMINIVCAGNILLLDSGWNYLWHYGFSKYRQPPDGSAWYEDDFENAKSKQYIVHYSSAIKPWFYPHLEDADIFWECARGTKGYSKILSEASKFKVVQSQKRLLAMRQTQN